MKIRNKTHSCIKNLIDHSNDGNYFKLPDNFPLVVDDAPSLYVRVFGSLEQKDIRNTTLCGYIKPSGEYIKCNELEHYKLIKDIVETDKTLSDIFDWWCVTGNIKNYQQEKYGSVFDIFVITYLGWIKVGAYPENIGKDDVHYMLIMEGHTLTSEQTDIVYPC